MTTTSSWIKLDGKAYMVGTGERALDAMLRGGAPVSFSCRKGTCRSCMLQATSGDPGSAATEKLPQEYRDHGFFLPCCATDVSEVEAVLPDLALCTQQALVAEKTWLADDVVQLKLEVDGDTTWIPGQSVGLINPDGVMRSYSIVSLQDQDFFLELHIKIYRGGAVSGWVSNGLNVGDTLRFQGPSGDFTYHDDLKDTPLVLLGTGTGGGAILGIARDAVGRGHQAPIHLYHGAKTRSDLYLHDIFSSVDGAQISVVQAASRDKVAELGATRITDIAFRDHPELRNSALFFCGAPEMIEGARVQALRQGARLVAMFSDPFEPNTPYMPDEKAKFQAIAPEPELWAALADGDKLVDILGDFYAKAYDDARLAPFFHRTTKQRAIDKQYSFLQMLFSGSTPYFGEKPFNAHHWMVISDELFDYREKMLMDAARAHGIAEHLLARWAAVHELFRREIVKSAPRGILRQGTEHNIEGYSMEIVDVGTVCDGCVSEISEGDKVRMHRRTGEIFCLDCKGKTIEDSAAA